MQTTPFTVNSDLLDDGWTVGETFTFDGWVPKALGTLTYRGYYTQKTGGDVHIYLVFSTTLAGAYLILSPAEAGEDASDGYPALWSDIAEAEEGTITVTVEGEQISLNTAPLPTDFAPPVPVSLTSGADIYVFKSSGEDALAVDGLDGPDNIVTAGGDILDAGGGADRLTGGAGSDRLTGGAGADVFVFDSADDDGTFTADVITDFDPGEDRVSISGFEGIQGFDAITFTSVGTSLLARLSDTQYVSFEGITDEAALRDAFELHGDGSDRGYQDYQPLVPTGVEFQVNTEGSISESY